MSEGDTEKVGIAYEESLNLTYKIRGMGEFKLASNISDLLLGRSVKSLVGKKISIFNNEKPIGEINADALLWTITKDLHLISY